MRDTAPPDEAKASYNTFKKVMIKRRAAGKRNPVDAYPGDLLFFMRVTQLLHGLGSLLHYMSIAPSSLRVIAVSEKLYGDCKACYYNSEQLHYWNSKDMHIA
eukprot:17211-Heterococcus_DN1.PRE.1